MIDTSQLSNLKPSAPDARDLKYAGAAPGTILPAELDHRLPDDETEDQGRIGKCTGTSTVIGLENLARRHGCATDISDQFLYFNTLEYENRLGQEGAQLRDALKMANKFGMADEALWPPSEATLFQKPPTSVYAQAATQRLGIYEAIPLDPDDWRGNVRGVQEALAAGHAVVGAFNVKKWFMYLRGPLETQNRLPTNVPGYMEPIDAAHAVAILGYSNRLSGLIGRCSWGPEFGDDGCFIYPYTMINDFFEFFVLRDFMGYGQIYDEVSRRATQLYVALFGRAPDVNGLYFWCNLLRNNSAAYVAQRMYDCADARTYYPANIRREDLLKQFYINVLGRLPDVAGLAFWNERFSSSSNWSTGAMLIELIDAVCNYAGTDADGVTSKAFFNNKVDVGLYCALGLGCGDVSIASAALQDVTADKTTIEPARAAIRAKLLAGGMP